MRIRFHGAIDEVTGSCYELIDEVMKLHILVDCGLVQGEHEADARNMRPFPFDPRTLTHVFLTHAHSDHSGLVPRLYAEGYRGTVYCTEETASLATLVQYDSAKLGLAPYSKKDVDAQKFHEPSNATTFRMVCPIATDFFAIFFRSGHMLGATSIQLLWGPKGAGQKSITFSGDIGPNREDEEVFPLTAFRMNPYRANYLVVESTYGGTVREPKTAENRILNLAKAVGEAVVHRKGTLIIPCFALERLPDVLCDLTFIYSKAPGLLNSIPVTVDSRLGTAAMRVMAQSIARSYTLRDGKRVRDVWLGRGIFRLLGLDWQSSEHRELVLDLVREMLLNGYEAKLPRIGGLAHWRRIWNPGTSKAAERMVPKGPAIVLATGGMCEGGPVQFYLRSLLSDPSTTVLFPGFCGPSTIGGKLLEMRDLDEAQRRRLGGVLELDGCSVNRADIRASIQKIDGYSAHADQAGLLDWMWAARPDEPKVPIASTIFVSHGTPEPRRKLKTAIEDKARTLGHEVKVELPPRGQWYDLDRGSWLTEGLTEHEFLRNELLRLRAENELLKRESSQKTG